MPFKDWAFIQPEDANITNNEIIKIFNKFLVIAL
jgi:hypothetical protein